LGAQAARGEPKDLGSGREGVCTGGVGGADDNARVVAAGGTGVARVQGPLH
jgi:hypothetical protein